MTAGKVFVFDTNTFISAHLLSHSVSNRAFRKAVAEGTIGMSSDLFSELADVLFRSKFDRYFPNDRDRQWALQNIRSLTRHFFIVERVTHAPDPDDNMVLELAIASRATAIISGDRDLLGLNPFRGIPILSPGGFLNWPAN